MKLFITLLIFPLFAQASGDFSMSLSRGSDREWIRVVPRGRAWDCVTNTTPMAEAPGNPLKTLNWAALEQEEKKMPKKCDTSVKINNTLEGKNKLVKTCLSQPATKALYDTMSGNCKSGI
jgi:hypothetical protein